MKTETACSATVNDALHPRSRRRVSAAAARCRSRLRVGAASPIVAPHRTGSARPHSPGVPWKNMFAAPWTFGTLRFSLEGPFWFHLDGPFDLRQMNGSPSLLRSAPSLAKIQAGSTDSPKGLSFDSRSFAVRRMISIALSSSVQSAVGNSGSRRRSSPSSSLSFSIGSHKTTISLPPLFRFEKTR